MALVLLLSGCDTASSEVPTCRRIVTQSTAARGADPSGEERAELERLALVGASVCEPAQQAWLWLAWAQLAGGPEILARAGEIERVVAAIEQAPVRARRRATWTAMHAWALRDVGQLQAAADLYSQMDVEALSEHQRAQALTGAAKAYEAAGRLQPAYDAWVAVEGHLGDAERTDQVRRLLARSREARTRLDDVGVRPSAAAASARDAWFTPGLGAVGLVAIAVTVAGGAWYRLRRARGSNHHARPAQQRPHDGRPHGEGQPERRAASRVSGNAAGIPFTISVRSARVNPLP